MMIQHVMQELVDLVVFVYVDDCFWVVLSSQHLAAWILLSGF